MTVTRSAFLRWAIRGALARESLLAEQDRAYIKSYVDDLEVATKEERAMLTKLAVAAWDADEETR